MFTNKSELNNLSAGCTQHGTTYPIAHTYPHYLIKQQCRDTLVDVDNKEVKPIKT